MRRPFLLFGLLLSLASNSQTGTVWYFGKNAGLDFNSTPPKPIYDGKIDQIEGCAVICDNAGKILLYSEGQNLWNRKHAIVQNGTNLGGHPSATQSGIIVPLPESTDIYYVFSVDYELNSGGLQYAIVDMSKNGGDGEVTSKNNKLKTPITEKITAVPHANGIDYWILSHEYGNNTFLAYLLTKSGLTNTPIKTNIGKSHAASQGQGSIKANLAGNTVVITDMLEYLIEIFDFNSSNGSFSNPITLTGSEYNRVYGVEFSPDGSKLYVSRQQNPSRMYQFDLSIRNLTAISGSRKLMYQVNMDYGLGALQLAPDGKIYCNQRNYTNPSKYLAVISTPDSVYPKCNFTADAIDLSPGMSWSGLPNFVSNIVFNEQVSINKKCLGDTTTFSLNGQNIDSCLWAFGDPSNTASRNLNTSFKYLDSGNYNITLTFYRKGVPSTRKIPISIIGNKNQILPNDTLFCNLANVKIEANREGTLAMKWYDNDTSYVKIFGSAGTYPYTFLSEFGCTVKDTIQIFITNTTSGMLGKDTTFCKGDSLILDAGPAVWVKWNTNDTTRMVKVKTAGVFSVQKNSACGIELDTIIISTIPKVFKINVADTLICNSSIISLSVANYGTTKWNTGQIATSIQVGLPDKYWAISSLGCEIRIDTFNVRTMGKLRYFENKDTVVCINSILQFSFLSSNYFNWNNQSTSNNYQLQFPDSVLILTLDTLNCPISDTLKIQYVPFEKLNINDSVKICEGKFIVLGPSHSKIQFVWNDNDTGAKSIKNSGLYSVNITSVCENTIKSFNLINENCSCVILVPNAFTPNIDLLNDDFKPFLNCTITDYTFRIYTTYGEKIFESFDQKNGWDGKYKSNNSNYMNVFM